MAEHGAPPRKLVKLAHCAGVEKKAASVRLAWSVGRLGRAPSPWDSGKQQQMKGDLTKREWDFKIDVSGQREPYTLGKGSNINITDKLTTLRIQTIIIPERSMPPADP